VTRFSLKHLQSGRVLSQHSLSVTAGPDEMQLSGQLRTEVEAYEIKEPKSGTIWLKFSASLNVPKRIKASYKATGDQVRLSIAVPQDPARQKIYVGLPTETKFSLPVSIDAPFNPNTNRVDILHDEWNEWLFQSLSQLLAEISTHLLSTDPKLAWNAIPLKNETDLNDEWLRRVLTDFIEGVHSEVQDNANVKVSGQQFKIEDLAYEVPELEQILTVDDFNLLCPKHRYLHADCRDTVRWRNVLDDIGVSQRVDIERALNLFDESGILNSRTPDWSTKLAVAALENNLEGELKSKNCLIVVDENGDRKISGANPNGRFVNPESFAGLAARLGLVHRLDPSYFLENDESDAVVSWLKGMGRLLFDLDGQASLDILAEDCRDDPREVSDEDLKAIRDEIDSLEEFDDVQFGPTLGKSISIDTYEWINGRRTDKKPRSRSAQSRQGSRKQQ